MKHFATHLCPYPDIPEDLEYDSAWVWLSNEIFDAEKAHQHYHSYIFDYYVEAERLGFDGVQVAEHHQTPYEILPAPNLMAAIIATHTERLKIAVNGNALPLYATPVRVAEEIAMLDVISGGRIISGQVVGGGPEYYATSTNPTEARGRFREAHELIMRSWLEPGPFSHYGKYYKLRYVNPWPRPLQKPHPPIWIPGAGSLETLEFVARHRYTYMGLPYFDLDYAAGNYARFREACEKEGYAPHPEQMGLFIPVYVAESDAKAVDEYERHLWFFKNRLLNGITLYPPGYSSPQSALRVARAMSEKVFLASCENWDDVERGGFAIVGSPETVAGRLTEFLKASGCGILSLLLHVGDMPAPKARENMRRYSESVLPLIRKAIPEPAEPMPPAVPFPSPA